MAKVKQLRALIQQYPKEFIIIALVWAGIGLYGSFPFFKTFYQKFLLLRYPPMERSVGYWGADWQAYEYLSKTLDQDDAVLFLSPNSYFFSRLILHLYPTSIEYVDTPKEALEKNIKEFDYVFVYIPMENSSGAVPGLTGNVGSWDVRELVKLHNLLAPDENIASQEDMIALTERAAGILLYTVEF